MAGNLIENLRQLGITRHNSHSIVYKYVPAETAKLILQNGTLMFQKAANFNDPFELHLGLLSFDFDGSVVDVYQKYFNKGKPVSDTLREALEKNGYELISEPLKKTFEEYRGNVGITCFTKDPTNTLMWSHYADSHKGVCIGFLIEGWYNVRDTFNVNYVPSIRPIKFLDDAEGKLALWHWVFTKSHIWAYEQEVRCANLFSNGVQPFEDIRVAEIYYGAGIAQKEIEEIERLVERYAVARKVKMEIDPQTFDLVQTEFRNN